MDPLWLLKGDYDAPGWRDLERDSKAEAVDLLMFDRLAWALVRAAEAPSQYQGLNPTPPPDGLYLDPYGRPVYLAGGTRSPVPRRSSLPWDARRRRCWRPWTTPTTRSNGSVGCTELSSRRKGAEHDQVRRLIRCVVTRGAHPRHGVPALAQKGEWQYRSQPGSRDAHRATAIPSPTWGPPFSLDTGLALALDASYGLTHTLPRA